MTLKAIESEFAEVLEKQMKEEIPMDLTLEGPIVTKLPPKLIWAKLLFKDNPQQELTEIKIPGFNYECFLNFATAEAKYPEEKLKIQGRPWAIHMFLSGEAQRAIIDFGELGAVLLSKSELPVSRGQGLYEHLLPLWLSYALSPELWGAVGKWPRFHERLVDLFRKHNLLDGKETLGYYPLVAEAEKLEDLGFPGTRLGKQYLLVLPWTFSLRDLNKLEEVIRQEF